MDFSSENMEFRKKQYNIFQVLKEKNYQALILIQWKYSLGMKRKSSHSQMKENKWVPYFAEMVGIKRGFVTSRPTLNELKQVLKRKEMLTEGGLGLQERR